MNFPYYVKLYTSTKKFFVNCTNKEIARRVTYIKCLWLLAGLPPSPRLIIFLRQVSVLNKVHSIIEV